MWSNSSIEDDGYPKTYNKYVYFKQNFVPKVSEAVSQTTKVLINPHFNSKVFLNPNYHQSAISSLPRKIHINPNIRSIKLSKENEESKIHVNPMAFKNGSTVQQPITYASKSKLIRKSPTNQIVQQPITYASKSKLIRKSIKQQTTESSKHVRRRSVYSKFKIVKSSAMCKSSENKSRNKLLFNSKYKLRRVDTNKPQNYEYKHDVEKNRFKLDNRKKCISKSKFIFINRFFSICDLAKTRHLRSLVGTSMIVKSPNKLQRIYSKEKNKKKNIEVTPAKPLKRTRYKIVRDVDKPNTGKRSEKKRMSRYSSYKKMFPGKLKKCNIPCPYYRKFGKCKRKDIGKCHRKHDPDQIALCMKFLQGACVDPNCLLSHAVSPEKMPTCKYYLEGSCARDHCPYTHVKINPKADVCKDFLEGFCKNASECDKRHQFLCPDFEKIGACSKPRCSYPHGRMVRKYSDFTKNRFAKKFSQNIEKITPTIIVDSVVVTNKIEENVDMEINTNTRYYSDKNIGNSVLPESESEIDLNKENNYRHRPKLGKLPSFISLEDI